MSSTESYSAPPLPDSDQAIWSLHYQRRQHVNAGRYPTEWVIRTLAGGQYPKLKLDKSLYRNARILDMGCGDGRNLPLLLDLGFEVHAMEISADIVSNLRTVARERDWSVEFKVGVNSQTGFADAYFDYVLCCSSCYYLSDGISWPAVRKELARILKPGGCLIANFPDVNNAVLANGLRLCDGTYQVTSDPFDLRNGIRMHVVSTAEEMHATLAPEFEVKGFGRQDDDFFGLRVSSCMAVGQKLGA